MWVVEELTFLIIWEYIKKYLSKWVHQYHFRWLCSCLQHKWIQVSLVFFAAVSIFFCITTIQGIRIRQITIKNISLLLSTVLMHLSSEFYYQKRWQKKCIAFQMDPYQKDPDLNLWLLLIFIIINNISKFFSY